MVKNREELLHVANSNSEQLKTHLRNAVSDFLKVQKVTVEELAYVLGVTVEELMRILEGDGNITLDTISKLLVATDMAVEIKPVSVTPLGRYGKNMPRSGGFPDYRGIPVDKNGRPLPPPPGWPMGGMNPVNLTHHREEGEVDGMREVPMNTSTQMRDSHGRFIKRQTATNKPAAPKHSMAAPMTENPYFSLSDADLANIIRQNIWDGEIDVNTATHEQLAEFVTNKERIMRERNGNNPKQTEQEKVARNIVNGGGDTLNQFINMLGNMAKEAKNNPALAEAIGKFMPIMK